MMGHIVKHPWHKTLVAYPNKNCCFCVNCVCWWEQNFELKCVFWKWEVLITKNQELLLTSNIALNYAKLVRIPEVFSFCDKTWISPVHWLTAMDEFAPILEGNDNRSDRDQIG